MADSFFNRQLLFVVVFLSTFALLVSQLPIELASPLTKRQVLPTEDWLSVDLMQYYETWSRNLNTTVFKQHDTLLHIYIDDVDLGNHDFDIFWSEPNYSNPIGDDHYISFQHWYASWIIFTTRHGMTFYNENRINRGAYVTTIEIDQDFDSALESSHYQVECNHFGVEVYIGYNTTTYDNATHAFDFNGIYVFVGIGFEDVGTSFNAWSLLNPMLFFQSPNTLNLINLFISIPIWISMIYVTITIILWFIPFLNKG